MKIIFISNRLTPHQIPICNAFHQKHQFFFIETMKEAIVEIGWLADGSKYPYVIPYTEDDDEIQRIHKLILDADVVIIGSAPDTYIIPRLKREKLTFKYAERFYKHGLNIRTLPRAVIGTWLHHGRFQKYPLYMLCASAYTPYDCARFGNYKNRMYKWGYFPETKHYDIDGLIQAKSKTSILWCGRMLDLKHPDDAISVAVQLKQAGYQFDLNLIGNGELYPILENMIAENGIGDCVHLLGAKPSDEVRGYMEKAGIYLFTSDRQEGWGAVLNESMNSGCAVVASHAIGSVPFLLKHGENGYVYHSGNVDELYQRVKYLLDNPAEQTRLGKNAYKTIITEWNAKNAAKQFVRVAQLLLDCGELGDLPKTGPCSRADVLEDDWFDEQ